MTVYDAYQQLMDNRMVLCVDTREKQTERYDERIRLFKSIPCFGGSVMRCKLDVGDYSCFLETPSGIVVDARKAISIDRKADLSEILRNFSGDDRKRYERELIRAREMNCKLYFIIECGSVDAMYDGDYSNQISQAKATGSYHAFENRYNIRFEFVSPRNFPRYTYDKLRRYLFDYICHTYPNGELL